MADHQDPPGGSGGEPTDHRRRIHDIRLFRRALREHWPIPKGTRPLVMDRLREVIEDTGSSPREVTAASAVLMQASRLNLDMIATAVKARESEELAQRIKALEATVHERSGESSRQA